MAMADAIPCPIASLRRGRPTGAFRLRMLDAVADEVGEHRTCRPINLELNAAVDLLAAHDARFTSRRSTPAMSVNKRKQIANGQRATSTPSRSGMEMLGSSRSPNATCTRRKRSRSRSHSLTKAIDTADELVEVWRSSAWRDVIDELRKQLRQALGGLLWREVRVSRDFVEAPLAEDLADRIGRNRHVLTSPYPGLRMVAEAGALHLFEQTAQTTASPRWRTAAEHLPKDVAEATASWHGSATPTCEHREHHRQERRHDVRRATARRGRPLGGTLTPLLTKAPTQRTTEQFV